MDEMQGVMALPEAQGAGMRPEDMALIEQIRQNVPRQEITQEFLAAGEQADPQAVAEFKQELAGLELTPDELNKLNTMVDAILAAPQDYASLRRAYLAEGMPEDLLPEQFDPAFFAALNMAIDTIAMNPGSPPPMAMAMGGVADLAAYGRNGDTMLAHITPQEAAMLKRMGGSGTINPYTGLPEYASIFKKIGNAVKKFAKSTVGKVIIGVGASLFLGPLAASFLGPTLGAAATGFAASAGTTLLSGGNLRDALKAGVFGGLSAGLFQGVTQSFQGLPTGAETAAAGAPSVSPTGATPAGGALPSLAETAADTAQTIRYPGSSIDYSQAFDVASAGPVELARPIQPVPVQATPDLGLAPGGIETLAQSPASIPSGGPLDMTNPMNRPYYDATMSGEAAPIVDRSTVMQPPRAGILENLSKGNFREAANQFMPGTIREQGYADAIARAKGILGEGASADAVMKLADKFAPGMVSQYGPMAGLALLGVGALGGFKTKDATPPDMALFRGPTPQQLAAARLYYGGIRPTSYGSMYLPGGYAEGGGVMDTPQAMRVGGKTYPRKIGAINGPGTGTSDSIPAMLSDGEFVFTAKAVRAMGNGSRRKGAKKMYKLMKMLEGKAA